MNVGQQERAASSVSTARGATPAHVPMGTPCNQAAASARQMVVPPTSF